jgi:hypothetical protein
MSIVYGVGGYDPDHPNGNVVEQVTDNGDGTGELVRFNPDGTIAATEALTELPIPPAPDPTELALEVLAEVVAARGPDALRQVVTLALAVVDQLDALDAAVDNEDPLAGIAIVADAAAAAAAEVI